MSHISFPFSIPNTKSLPLAAPHLNGTIHAMGQVLEYHHILMALRGVLFVFAPSDRQVPTHASPLDADKYLGYVSNLLIGKTSGLSDSRIPGCLARWHCVLWRIYYERTFMF